MNKKILPVALLLLSLVLTSCNIQNSPEEQKKKALSLSIESNLQYREVSVSCDWFGGKIVSKIVMVPLNKQIIDAAIDYNLSRRKLSDSEVNSLRQRSYKEFLESKKSAFVLVVVNNEKLEAGKNAVGFDKFLQNVRLYGKSGKPYKMVDYSRNLGGRLNPGWNEGYVYFENFREKTDDLIKDYTVRIDNYYVACDQASYKTEQLSFRFDESDINFLAEIQSGLDESKLREIYVTNKYEAVGLKPNDVLNLVRFVAFLMK
jgi:hypothetical protein